ncbi:MAG: hypothetical protein AB1Z98_25675 [Nannocystaceae bacterium]
MSEPAQPRAIGLVVEAAADEQTARILTDRVLVASRDWVDEPTLEALRQFRGIGPGSEATLWKEVRGLAREHGVRKHGHFSGEPGAPDAQAARRALILFHKLGMPDAVVLVRDADAQPQRRRGLSQARGESPHSSRVAVGVAIPEREAWVLAGFEPRDDDEVQALAHERRRLGFDPSDQPERLGGDGKRSAKTALRNLSGGNRDRERECLDRTPLESLRRRGARCGLSELLDELRTRVVPSIV